MTVDNVYLPPAELPAGFKQRFAVSEAHAFFPARYELSELTKETQLSAYPIVISLETSPLAVARDGAEPQCFLMYCTLYRNGAAFGVRVLKSVVRLNGCAYLLHEIFGLSTEKEDEANECVVCITDPRDTVVLPCRHMCLCSSCAKELRQRSNRCPMCRVPFQSLLQFRVSGKAGAGSDGGSSDDSGRLVR